MEDSKRIILLKIVLVLVGLTFTFGLYPLMTYWSDAWTWEPRHYEYEQMIMGVYATLGIFLLIASRHPMRHTSLIWFTAISSLVHGVIMLIQGMVDHTERANLCGDVPALIIVGIVLCILTPRRAA